MNMRNSIFIIMAVALVACRANPPRPEAEPSQFPRSATDQVVSIDDSTRAASQQTNGGGYLAGDGPGTDAPPTWQAFQTLFPATSPCIAMPIALHRDGEKLHTSNQRRRLQRTRRRLLVRQEFHGQKTSIGEIYDMYGMTAAHTPSHPSYARVTNLQNNKSVIVRVNDRGPFLHERIIDLSYTAATKLGIIGSGQGQVEVESLTADANAAAPISPSTRNRFR